jgi:hypothetical protein
VRKMVMVERWWIKNEVTCLECVMPPCFLCLLDVDFEKKLMKSPPNQNLKFLFRNYRCLNYCTFLK